MKKFLHLCVVALLLAGATESFAQSRNRGLRVDDRQRVRSGEITRAEARRARYIRNQHRDGERRRSYNNVRNDRRRGNGYYRRGAGSPSHPVFGNENRRRYRHRNRHRNN